MTRRYLLPVSLVNRLLGRNSSNEPGKCIYWRLTFESKQCVLSLISKTVFRDILVSNDICSLCVSMHGTDVASAFRVLESEALNLEVQAERSKRKSIAERKRAVDEAIRVLALYGKPVIFSLTLYVCSKLKAEEIASRVSMYGCRPRVGCAGEPPCGKNAEKKFFRGIIGGIASLPVSQAVVALLVREPIEYYASLFLASTEHVSVPLGYALRSGFTVYLPLFDSELNAYHTLVTGPTGSGKTTLLAYIAAMLLAARSVGCIHVIDPKGDLSSLLSRFNSSAVNVTVARSTNEIKELLSVPPFCRKGPRVLLIDEAWRVDQAFLVAAYKLSRSKKLAVVAATQDPWDVDARVWNNISNVVLFGSGSLDYVRRVEKLIGPIGGADVLRSLINSGDFAIRYKWSSMLIEAKLPPAVVAKLLGSSPGGGYYHFSGS